jgi:hypothetical protein
MMCGSRRSALFLSSALSGLILMALGGQASAADQTYQFDIPAESVGQALTDFSKASSQQIVFSEEVTKGKARRGFTGVTPLVPRWTLCWSVPISPLIRMPPAS